MNKVALKTGMVMLTLAALIIVGFISNDPIIRELCAGLGIILLSVSRQLLYK